MKERPGTVLALLGLVLIVVAVSVTATLVREPRPSLLEPAASATTFATSPQTFADERVVDLSVDLGEVQPVVSQKAGTVTSSACRPGDDMVSGVSTVEIDGVPLVNLATARPLWRDLDRGADGADVASFQDEMVRLGRLHEATGVVDDATIDAAEALGVIGVPGAAIPRSSLLWIPTAATDVESCMVGTGQNIAVGETLVIAPAQLRAVALNTVPPALTPGVRTLVVDEESFVLGPDGRITDPESLQTAARLPSVIAHRLSGGTTLLSGRYTLTEPLTVSAVPVRALAGVDATGGSCLSAAGDTVEVTVVGSELGRSLVVFDAGVMPPEIDLVPAPGLTCE